MDELPLPWPEFREVWRPIPGFRDYDVSSNGRVRSRKRAGKCNGSEVIDGARVISGVVMEAGGGYPKVMLRCEDGKRRLLRAHRLLMLAFVGPEPDGTGQRIECRHIDGIRTNCTVNNLCWGTCKENKTDMIRHGTRRNGEVSHLSKLTEADVQSIRERAARGETQRSIAAGYNVTEGNIGCIVRGETWRHVA